MATLTTERRSGKTTGYNVQWYDGKRRITIHLGGKRYTKKTAERFKDIVEALLFYRRNGITTPEKSVEHWMQNAPVELKAKQAKAELLIVEEAKTCQQLWDSFLKHRTDIKPATENIYRNARTRFFEAFSEAEPMDKITPDRLDAWRISMLDKFKEATVATHLKTVNTVLNWAVKRAWLRKNPLSGIPKGSFQNKDSKRRISMDEYGKLLVACPNQEWRTIIALARIGGLRCPSELQQLRWSDINWQKKRFVVRSPKTEHHEGQDKRIVPLFPELRSELEKHFSAVESDGNEFVIQVYQRTSWVLYEPFQKIAHGAGLGTIVSPFVNMRRSRSNEVLRKHGSQLESLGIGHSEKVMEEHYFEAEDEDFEKATC